MHRNLLMLGCPARWTICLVIAMLASSEMTSLTSSAQQPATYAGRTVEQWTQVLADHVGKDTEEDKEVARQASQALGVIGPPAEAAVPLLIEAIRSPKIETREAAVDALGRIGPAAAASVPAILREVDIPKDHRFYTPLTEFRRLAARSLGRMGSAAEEAVPVLEAALRNEDILYRVEAALALWRINRYAGSVAELESLIRADHEQGPFEAVIALGEMGAEARPAIPALLAALRHPQPDLRRAAAKVLIGFGFDTLPALAETLADPELQDPRPVTFAIGQIIGQNRKILLQGEIPPALQQAVEQAGPAMASLLAHPNTLVRQTASRSLSQAGLAAVPFVLEMLDHDSPAARQAAAETLVRIEPHVPPSAIGGSEELKQRILPRLMQLMRHEDPQVQAAAFRAFAVIRFGDAGREAIPLLRNALRNPDVAIRRHAAKALEQYEGK